VKVSWWGGFFALRTAVNQDQKLSVVNQATGETAESKLPITCQGPCERIFDGLG
jgi:hypothetical protein